MHLCFLVLPRTKVYGSRMGVLNYLWFGSTDELSVLDHQGFFWFWNLLRVLHTFKDVTGVQGLEFVV